MGATIPNTIRLTEAITRSVITSIPNAIHLRETNTLHAIHPIMALSTPNAIRPMTTSIPNVIHLRETSILQAIRPIMELSTLSAIHPIMLVTRFRDIRRNTVA